MFRNSGIFFFFFWGGGGGGLIFGPGTFFGINFYLHSIIPVN